jgi:hypothetical protein
MVSYATNVHLKHNYADCLTVCKRALQTRSITQYIHDKIEHISCQSCHVTSYANILSYDWTASETDSKLRKYNSMHYILTHYMIM